MQKNVPLKEKTAFKIGGYAKYLFEVSNVDQLRAALHFAKQESLPWVVTGVMSNILLPDGELPVVIQMTNSNRPLAWEGDQLKVWTGDGVARIAWQTMNMGYEGLEEFASLPGTVGGAVWNNSHYRDSFISDNLVGVNYLDTSDGQMKYKAKEELEYGYDQSWWQAHPETIIVEAIFALRKAADMDQVKQKSLAATARRASSQPLDQACAGCFWQNPVNTPELRERFPQFATQERISAGWLIDQAGLKGVKVGDAAVSDKHAAFIINLGEATSEQVKELAGRIKEAVREKFGVTLEQEVVSF